MRAHVQPVGDQGDRAEQSAADNLGDHHRGAEPDHGPRFALALFMPFAEEHVAVKSLRVVSLISGSFQIGADDLRAIGRSLPH